MARIFILFYLFVFLLFGEFIQDISGPVPVKETKVNYSLYDKILKKFVNKKGEVNYFGLKKETLELLKFIRHLQEVSLQNLTSEEELCYYINLYNAVVLYQVAIHYPFRSVMVDFPGKNFFKNEFYFQGKTISLDFLENEIIRKKFKNPYIHFALNCASRSCPILEPSAWKAKGLKRRFFEAASRYLKDIRHNRYGKEKNILYLSELFRWYQEDFPDLARFYEKHTGIKVLPQVKIEFLPYDWSLNEQKP